jgi:hypothetical protein
VTISKDLKERAQKTREDGVFTLSSMKVFPWRCW